MLIGPPPKFHGTRDILRERHDRSCDIPPRELNLVSPLSSTHAQLLRAHHLAAKLIVH